jgi:hypothetical protein
MASTTRTSRIVAVAQWPLVFVLVALGSGGHLRSAGTKSIPQPTRADDAHMRVLEAYGKLPMRFEANAGQTDGEVKFLSRGNGYSVFLTPTETVFSFADFVQQKGGNALARRTSAVAEPAAAFNTIVRMKLVGANPPKQLTGRDPLPGRTNYVTGSDTSKWHTNIPGYAKVHYDGVYPGIDLLYHGNQGQLEYDFLVSPGANPNVIRFNFEGVDRIRVDAAGELALQLADREVRQNRPVVYQEFGGVRHTVAGGYVLDEARTVGFRIRRTTHGIR